MRTILLYSAFRPAWTGPREVCVSIDLTQIEDRPIAFEERLDLPFDRLDPDHVAGSMKVHLKGRVLPVGDGFFVEGDMHVEGELLCTRCLIPVTWTKQDQFSVELRFPEEGGDDEVELAGGDLDVIFLEGNTVNLENLAAEQVTLNLPMRLLCREDCAGLCQQCGANLNQEGACQCKPEVDPRWQALQDLKGRPS